MANWQSGSWRGNPAEGFSAGYTGMGVHFSDMFIHLFGGIDEVQAMRANRVLDYPGGDVSTVQFRFVNGGTGVLTNIVCTPHYSRLHIFGSKGWVEARHDASASTASVRGAVTVANEKAELSTREFPPHDAVRANLLVFAAAVEQQRPGPFTPFEARHNVQVLEAVSAALKEDGQVKLAAA
jgi:predicted dehydrogenase